MRHLAATFSLFLALAMASAAPLTSSAMAQDSGSESSLLDRINEVRRQAGAAPLARDPGLDGAARLHSAEMAAADQLMHVSPTTGTPVDRVHAAGHATGEVAENVAMHGTAAEAQQALEASDAHLANMLNPRFTHVGLAVAPDQGGVYVTQVFARLEAEEQQPAPEPEAPVEAVPPPPVVAAPAPAVVAPPAAVAAPSAAPAAVAPALTAEAESVAAGQVGTPGQVVGVQGAQGAMQGYWVCSSGRWWYYPMPSGTSAGQLQADVSVTGAPPGYGACAGGAAGTVAVGGAAPASGYGYGAPAPAYGSAPAPYAAPAQAYGSAGGVYPAPAPGYAPGYRPAPVYTAPRVVVPGMIGPWGGVRVAPQPYYGPARPYYGPQPYGRRVIVVR